jgi:hypothetical protein
MKFSSQLLVASCLSIAEVSGFSNTFVQKTHSFGVPKSQSSLQMVDGTFFESTTISRTTSIGLL